MRQPFLGARAGRGVFYERDLRNRRKYQGVGTMTDMLLELGRRPGYRIWLQWIGDHFDDMADGAEAGRRSLPTSDPVQT